MDGNAFLKHTAGVLRRRRDRYGDPEINFEQIATRWSMTLGAKVTPAQVALCLIDLKMARLSRDPCDLDSQTDVAGYAACLREVTRDV
jgi:hypothetical protein